MAELNNNINANTFTYGDEFYERLDALRATMTPTSFSLEENPLFNNFGSIFGSDNNICRDEQERINSLNEREEKLNKEIKRVEQLASRVEKVKEKYIKENADLIKRNSELLEDKDINSEFLCVICLTDTKQCLLEPCGHLATCMGCYLQGKLRTCPCCRTPISNMRKIFI